VRSMDGGATWNALPTAGLSSGVSVLAFDPQNPNHLFAGTGGGVFEITLAPGPMTLTANPNPITLAAGTTVGKTTLSWNAPGNNALQIWVSGVLFAAGLPASGTIDTGNWVSDGTPFTLVNPATAQTIASATVAAK
jgi:hypothetical protein